MLSTLLLPHFTYRRHCARTLAYAISGKAGPGPMFDGRNWRHFSTYALRSFVCNVCGRQGKPFFDFPDLERRRTHRIGELRETLQCRGCGATLRHRALAAVLLELASAASGRPLASINEAVASDFGGLRVLDTDSYSPIARILRRLPQYLVSSFRPGLPFDHEIEPGHYNINLEKIGFDPATFDLVITSDVMEHVRNDTAAHREIARILRPGGHYVFTVPYDDSCEDEHLLVDSSGPEDRFLVPPQYHGDPISGGILAYRVYGRSLPRRLAEVGLSAHYRLIDDPKALIVAGDVFVATRVAEGPAQ